MANSFLEKLKNIPRYWFMLAAIVAVGIFLRTWNHHDWLRFNADQGRDAALVSSVADGTSSWPLLGPKAGGTQFKLGPAFYYFEIISAKIFGNAPDKMAYPDLFTSILCIPLLFFFLKKYFEKYTSLALTAIFAASAYAVFYSRFAWNPNSLPFWTMLSLFALHEVISVRKNRKYLWAIVAGAAIGVDIQLHTTMLVILTLTTMAVFVCSVIKDKKNIKYFLVVLAASLLANGPQLASEFQTKGKNIQAFFGGLQTKNKVGGSVIENAVQSASCFVQSNTYILSGYEISDNCSFNPGKKSMDTLIFFFGALFAVGGIFIGIRDFFTEANEERRLFLGIIFVFVGITFLIFWKMAQELSVRFYLPLIFFPFLLLGFWIRFIVKKFNFSSAFGAAIAALLIFSNLYFVQKYFTAFAEYAKPGGGSVDVFILKEAEIFSQFIIENSQGSADAYIAGDIQFLFKGVKSIKYLAGRSGINLIQADKNSQLPDRYFLITSLDKKEKLINAGEIKIVRDTSYGGFVVMLVQNI
jgi:4-amino-4-deoxy-L-arabinose transferase-like glycosyltransferase